MAQKDKIKELVGRSLNSYHTKSLQQIDRIEKKNKEQNHKISILSNELDNDYLTKIEEGSVISLEHSKEGMVYIDSLEGNTLVNYCTDGSKEMTLNGDIDVEGTFVTTTEGVDGGKVDVLCEGNTLILDENGNEVEAGSEGARLVSVGQDDENGHKIEILSQSSYPNLIKKSKNLSGNRTGSDTSNNNGVQYLREDNVEFARVSANKQDFSNFYWWLQTVEPRKKGETYTISYDYRCVSDWGGYWYPSGSYNGNFFPSTNGEWRRMKITRTVTSGDAKDDMLFGVEIRGTETGDYIDIKNVKMEKGTNNSKWIPSVMDEEFLLAEYSNKKEILLNEPLRRLPNEVKDKIVKIGGKSYIERNCGEVLLGSNDKWSLNTDMGDVIQFTRHNRGSYGGGQSSVLSDRFITLSGHVAKEGVWIYSNNTLVIHILKTRLATQDLNGFKQWLQNNPTRVVYQLSTPIYEPLEVESTLNTYNDVTHISNNSIIPCNMKIQNSGYNTIIKPSTLYTVALDTNKSGTIGMNLGGAKGTTTNNVLTLTTPATLTDDSLRIYGKGIKGSKVRLLEGDKTNWIPSHFEGMKSSFEDKFDTTDNTYKMEILNNNENLIDLNNLILTNYNDHTAEKITNGFKIKSGLNGQWGILAEFKLRVKPNTKYTLGITKTVIKNAYEGKENTSWDVGYTWIKTEEDNTITEFKLNNDLRNTKTFNTRNNTTIRIRFTTATDKPITTGEYDFTDISLVENDSNKVHIPQKHNKIQFSSIEPLRSLPNGNCDRFVFKDNKLFIERNCGVITLDKLKQWNVSTTDGDKKTLRFWSHALYPSVLNLSYNRDNLYCDKLANYDYANTLSTIDNMGIAIQPRENDTQIQVRINKNLLQSLNQEGLNNYFENNIYTVVYEFRNPTYEEVPHELQKIILEGYENGTLFFDTNIPPTSTVTYAGETPIVKSVKLNKTEVLNNTTDINDNIIPYLMDMDYRVVCLELATETQGISMARLFGGVYEMLKRDILSNRYSIDEYKHRLDVYLGANKITEEEYNKLGDMLNE